MTTQGTQGNQETPSNRVTSEIARFLEQWDAEAEATQRALEGYAITARHDFINKRMQAFRNDKIIDMMILEAEKMREKDDAQNNASSNNTPSYENRETGEKEET